MTVIGLDDAAKRLNVAPSSLLSERYRRRLGLPVVRIGRKVGFAEEDVEAVIQRGREVLRPETEAASA
jgi:hypothetical protein